MNRITKISFSVSVLFLTWFSSINAQDLASANAAFNSGDYVKAEKIYGVLYAETGDKTYWALVTKSKECRENLQRGNAFLQDHNYAEAYRCFVRIIELNPNDFNVRQRLDDIKPWIDNSYVRGCLILKKQEGVYLAVQELPFNQIKCNRESAREQSMASRQGNLSDWRIPSVEEMKLILQNISPEKLRGDSFWCGDYSRQIRITRNPRTQEITSRQYLSYNAYVLTRTGRLVPINQPSYMANFFVVRDFDKDCVQCPRTTYTETR